MPWSTYSNMELKISSTGFGPFELPSLYLHVLALPRWLYITVGKPRCEECATNLDIMMAVCHTLGVPLAHQRASNNPYISRHITRHLLHGDPPPRKAQLPQPCHQRVELKILVYKAWPGIPNKAHNSNSLDTRI